MYIYSCFQKKSPSPESSAILWGRSYSLTSILNYFNYEACKLHDGPPPDEIDDENVEQILGVSNVWGNKKTPTNRKYIHAGAKKGMIDS